MLIYNINLTKDGVNGFGCIDQIKSLSSLYYAETCKEFAGPTSASQLIKWPYFIFSTFRDI